MSIFPRLAQPLPGPSFLIPEGVEIPETTPLSHPSKMLIQDNSNPYKNSPNFDFFRGFLSN